MIEQKKKLPKASSKTEIIRILGVFNLYRGSCPNLAMWVHPLQEMLKSYTLPKGQEVMKIT